MTGWTFSLIGTACFLLIEASSSLGQANTVPKKSEGAVLINELGKTNSEIRSASFDFLFHELYNKPGSTGYVILYCGKSCLYGEVESHIRGIEIKIWLREFDRRRLKVINAGFRDSFSLELWVVPAGASPPTPNPSVNIKDVVFRRGLRLSITPYDCCDDPDEVWDYYKKNKRISF